MKKIISILLTLAIILSFSGCTTRKGKDYIPENAKAYGYNYFPNSDWGMTKDELFSAFKKQESDFAVAEEKLSEATSITHYTTDIKFLDKKCSVSFNFQNAHYSDEKTLFSVSVSYPVEKETMENIEEKVEVLLKEQGIEYNDDFQNRNDNGHWISHKYISKTKMSDLPVDIKKGYVAYHKNVVNEKNPIKDPHIDRYDENTVPLDEYLSTISINYFTNDDKSVVCQIGFNGYGYALAISFNKANSK